MLCNMISGAVDIWAREHDWKWWLLVPWWQICEPCLQYHVRFYQGCHNTLHWRHNDHDGVSNHQLHGCLLNVLFGSQIKENTKAPRHWPLCGEFTSPGEFPAQRATNAENISIWWRHQKNPNSIPTKKRHQCSWWKITNSVSISMHVNEWRWIVFYYSLCIWIDDALRLITGKSRDTHIQTKANLPP